MSNNSSVPDFLPCGYNWTGPTAGETAFLSTDSLAAGYIACGIAVLLYGSNFVPYKLVNARDGFFAQWVMCCGVWIIGIIVLLLREQPTFYPWTVFGGGIWTIGNCCAVPVINLIGLSIGILIWNCTNVLVGWATGRFGLFGLCLEDPGNEIMNYFGVVLCVLASGVYALVKTETRSTLPSCCRRTETLAVYEPIPGTDEGDDRNITSNEIINEASLLHPPIQPEDFSEEQDIFLPSLSPKKRRILGVALALGSGACYGTQFLNAIYIQNHTVTNGIRASQNGLDYVFSQFCGIFLGSTIIFIGYVAIKRTKSFVSSSLVFPSLIAGLLWGIATCSFFLANSVLEPAISFPIIATVPGMIATLWGVFMFSEIRGLRNFIILGIAFSLTISGALLTAISK